MRQWTIQEDVRRRVMLAGASDLGESGGLFYPSLARREQVEWHFRQLARYLPLFRRAYVNIATGEGLMPPAEVRRRILAEAVSRGTDAGQIRFLETPNSPDGEVTPFFNGLLPLTIRSARLGPRVLCRERVGRCGLQVYRVVLPGARADYSLG